VCAKGPVIVFAAKQNGDGVVGVIGDSEIQVSVAIEIRDGDACRPPPCCGILARRGVKFSGEGVVRIMEKDRNRRVILARCPLVRYH
jgi:hypothetical protein